MTLTYHMVSPCWYEQFDMVWFQGSVLPYLGMVGRFHSDDPRFLFSIWLGSYGMHTRDLIDPPLSAEKISLSLSYLVPEILGPKVGLIFHQNVLFNSFWAVCMNFLWFSIKLTLSFIDLRSLWPLPHSYKTLDLIETNFYRVLNPSTKHLL